MFFKPRIPKKTNSLRTKIAVLPAVLALLCCLAPAGRAQIFKYQKDGVWYYTDTPTTDLPADRQELPESRPGATPQIGGTALLSDYPARTPIEKATAGTVAIQSALGFGSGFFISGEGYLITNKHVIRTTKAQSTQSEDFFNQTESRIDHFEKQFAQEAQRLQNFRARLKKLKEAADAESNPQRKQAFAEDYRENLETFRKWTADFEKRQRTFEEEKRRFRSSRESYDYGKIVADLSQSFTIFLADNSQYYVRLVAVSNAYDLALLKLDGYQVPPLRPAETGRLIQGDPLYAIGSPVKLKNSVTSGVFSGFENGFIQTDTRIYPGNSGGPLVDAAGRVVGINTFKKLTHKFEGLGFAIPIQVALQEFAAYLP